MKVKRKYIHEFLPKGKDWYAHLDRIDVPVRIKWRNILLRIYKLHSNWFFYLKGYGFSKWMKDVGIFKVRSFQFKNKVSLRSYWFYVIIVDSDYINPESAEKYMQTKLTPEDVEMTPDRAATLSKYHRTWRKEKSQSVQSNQAPLFSQNI